MPIPLASVVGIQALTMAIAERKRAQSDFELRKYPGGKFDVLGLADKLDLEDMKKKEIANGAPLPPARGDAAARACAPERRRIRWRWARADGDARAAPPTRSRTHLPHTPPRALASPLDRRLARDTPPTPT